MFGYAEAVLALTSAGGQEGWTISGEDPSHVTRGNVLNVFCIASQEQWSSPVPLALL